MRRKEKENSVSDNILLTLASLFFHKEPVKGRTRFQKTIFLLQRQYGVSFDFYFRPYYYGPYSEDLSDLVFFLRALDFVEETTDYLGMRVIRYNYQLTEKGERYFKILEKNAERETRKAITNLERKISRVRKLSTPELISRSKSLMNRTRFDYKT